MTEAVTTVDGLLETLADPGRRVPLLREWGLAVDEVRLTWFRGEGSERALVGLELIHLDGEGESRSLPAYLKLHADPARNREIAEKWRSLRVRETPLGPGVRELPSGLGLLLLFPHDAGLRRLAEIVDFEKLKRLLGDSQLLGERPWRVRASRSQMDVLRWKPEHRLVARLRLSLKDDEDGTRAERAVFLRLFPDDRGARQFELQRAIAAAGGGDLVAPPLGTLLDGRVYLEEALVGRDFFADRRHREAPGARDLDRLLQSFAALRPEAVRTLATRDLLAVRRAEIRSLARCIDAARLDRLDQLLRAALPAEAAERRGLVHGDLHLRQVMRTHDGLRLIDLERTSIGDPVIDIGHLAAEIEILSMVEHGETESLLAFRDEFLACWRNRATAEERSSLSFFIAAGLVAGAARAARRTILGEDGALASRLLDLALGRLDDLAPGVTMRVVESSSDWEELYPRRQSPWPARGPADEAGKPVWGLFDPDASQFVPMSPERDEALPALAELVERGELVAWRPGQRAVVRIAGTEAPSFAKCLTPSKARRLVSTLERLESLRQVHGGPAIPQVLETRPDEGVVVLTAVPGTSLLSRLERGDLPAIARAGEGLAAFQRLGKELAAEPTRPDDLDGWAGRALRAFPSESDRIERARARVPAARPGAEVVLVHGDLHDKNILISASGAGFIDLDSISLGPAERDLGNLMAHFDLRVTHWGRSDDEAEAAIASLLVGYSRAGGLADPEALDVERRRSRFRLGLVHLFRRNWQDAARRLLDRSATAPLLVLLACLLGACNSFVPHHDALEGEAVGAPPEAARLGASYIGKKQTVKVFGHFDGEDFVARSISIKEDDRELEVKGPLLRVDLESESLQVGGFVYRIGSDSKLVDERGSTLQLADLREFVGRRCKAEGVAHEDGVQLRKLELRDLADATPDHVKGRVTENDASRRRLEIEGHNLRYPPGVPVAWDVHGKEAPPESERRLQEGRDPRFKTMVRVDEDSQSDELGYRIGDFLSVGGKIRYDIEWRKNHDLRNLNHQSRLTQEPSASLELQLEPHEQIFGYAQVRFGREMVIFDEDRKLRFPRRLSLEQAFVLLMDVPFDGVSLEIGRQRFDHGREAVMNDSIDGLRLFVDLDETLLEVSVSQQLFDENDEEDGVTNWLAAAHIDAVDGLDLMTYALYRHGGLLVDLDRLHLGASLEWELGPATVWADLGYVVGDEDGNDVEGFGIDLMAMYVFEELPMEPTVAFGFALGSGDDTPLDGHDSSYRQTGLHRNNDRFNGVTSFRYLGELVRPELSNIMVFTTAFGLRPSEESSVDVIWHVYSQVEAAPYLRDTRIRLMPLGQEKFLGQEIDLVIGLEDWQPIEVEIVLGYFNPGDAFGPSPDDAWFFTFKFEVNF